MARGDDFSVFCNKFQPIMEDPDELKKYHWAGEDLEQLQNEDVHNIWTILDCDGKMYISPGWHYVNRMDYLITKHPWKEGQRDYLY
jgi:hypothetical protein